MYWFTHISCSRDLFVGVVTCAVVYYHYGRVDVYTIFVSCLGVFINGMYLNARE